MVPLDNKKKVKIPNYVVEQNNVMCISISNEFVSALFQIDN